MFLLDLFDKGGVVMIILFALSTYVLAVIMYKVYQFWKLGVYSTNPMQTISPFLDKDNKDQAIAMLNSITHPTSKVIETTLKTISNKSITDDKRERIIETVGSRDIRTLESHLPGLEVASTISPLLGLLGTVIGMVHAFSSLEQLGSRVDPSVLAGGIWEALLTTIAGLTVAIPALVAHHYFDNQVEKTRATMKDSVGRLVAKL